jgi:hypothetical protein
MRRAHKGRLGSRVGARDTGGKACISTLPHKQSSYSIYIHKNKRRLALIC